MKKIKIKGSTGISRIVIGESLRNLSAYVPQGRAVVITDTTVDGLYGAQFQELPAIVIGTGERVKQLVTLEKIYRAFIDHGVDRDTFVIGIGGGVVCDVTGFAASTFMRGVPFGFVATTLLAQVDAGVGGKNGVNFGGFKNMIGVFNQPAFVLCDPSVLRTLSRADVANGMAEVVKHALIADPEAFEFIETHAADILDLKSGIIEKAIGDAVRIKAAVVREDELEKGERRKLNFGHTFGHAVEAMTALPHGEAVSIGMVAAVSVSVARGLIKEQQAKRIITLLERLGLPTKMAVRPADIVEMLRRDKKRSGRSIHFILLNAIGEAIVEKMPLAEIERLCLKNPDPL
jgi:3-dehydroquinate synthase